MSAQQAQSVYQIPNSDFEKWAKDNEPGNGWNSFASATGSYNWAASLSPAPKKVGGYNSTYAVSLKSKSTAGKKANGNLTTGIINMGSMTPDDATKNFNFTDRGNNGHYLLFDGTPDSVSCYAKFTSGGSENGRAQFILHGDCDYHDPEDATQVEYKIGSAAILIKPTTEWTYWSATFNYTGVEKPEKQYMLASLTTNPIAGASANDELIIDCIRIIYNSELATLTYDDENIFVKGRTAYDLSDKAYDASLLTCTSNGRAATIEQSYNEATGLLTITVKGDDWSEENLNQHVYTIQFKTYTGEISSISYNGTPIANFSQGTNHYYTVQGEYADGCLTATTEDEGLSAQITYDATTRIATISVPESGKEDINYYVKFAKEANQYTSKLVISMMNSFLTAPVQGVGITEEIDGKVDLQLQNFDFQGTNMGDIYVHDVAISADGKLSKTDVIRIFGEEGNTLGDLSVTLDGNLTDGELSASLNILWMNLYPIVVTVYPQTTSSIDLTAINEITESNITVVQEGLTNSNCIIYAASDVDAGEARNVVTGTTCQSLELDAAGNIEIPTGFTATSISLDRTFHAGWNTVCLPFSTTTDALGATQIQEFTAFEDESLKFEKVTNGTIEANKPYLIYFEEAPTATVFELSGEVMTTEPEAVTFGDVTFTGNYTAGMSMEGYYGVADQNGSQYIMKGGSNSTLGSTGAYFSVAGAAAEVNRLALDLEGVTAIGSVETEGAEDAFDVYSISGVKVRTGATNLDGLQRGLYIVNGKKVLVK